MSKNVILNGQTYNGVSEVSLPVSGGTALFKDEDEIVTPSGTKQITANGTYDVSGFENANVNVQGGGDTPTYQEKTITENGTYTPDSGYDALSKVIVNVSGGGAELNHTTFTLEENSSGKVDISSAGITNDAQFVFCLLQNRETVGEGNVRTVGSVFLPNLGCYVLTYTATSTGKPSVQADSNTDPSQMASFGTSRPLWAGSYDIYWI